MKGKVEVSERKAALVELKDWSKQIDYYIEVRQEIEKI
jgi:hypothetical protein